MRYLFIIIFAIGFTKSYAQLHVSASSNVMPSKGDTSDRSPGPFYLGKFKIDPAAKTVSIRSIGGKGAIGEEIIFTPDRRINYDSTALIILGQQMLFKEYFPKECNLDHIRLLQGNEYGTVFISDSILYVSDKNTVSKGINISCYKVIDNFFFADSVGAIYFLGNKLEKITGLPQLDIKTLKHLSRHYFTDKNGLYFLGTNYDDRTKAVTHSVKVEEAGGKKARVKVTKNYIVYNSHVYSIGEEIFKLDLDGNNMNDVEWAMDYYHPIFDNNNLYEKQQYAYTARDKDSEVYAMKFFAKKKIRLLSVLPPELNFVAGKDSSVMYLPLNKQKEVQSHGNYKPGILVNTSDGYYYLNRWLRTVSPQKIRRVMVYNIDTKRNENFDIHQFRFINDQFFAYKNRVFFDYKPLLGRFDTKRLFCPIDNNNEKTNYITDGKILIGIGTITGYSIKKINDLEYIYFEGRALKNINLSKIRVVNKDVLIDDKNIYNFGSVIPLNKLGMKVKIFIQ